MGDYLGASDMYIVTVTPLARGIGKETLSYYSAQWIPVGCAIKVSVRRKKVWALVVNCEKVKEKKAAVKSARFALKPIQKQKPRQLFLPSFVDTAGEIARKYASTTGAVLFSMSPQHIIESLEYSAPEHNHYSEVKSPNPQVIHASYTDRPLLFRRLARETLATERSCYLITPTINSAKELYDQLSRGIEEQSFLLHSDQSNTETKQTWLAAVESEQPILLIATPTFLSLPRSDIATFIVESESDQSYKHRERPFVDMRDVIATYARKLGATIHFADNFFRAETYHHFSDGEYDSSFPFSFRTCSELPEELIDMNKETLQALSGNQTPRTITIPLLSTRLVGKISTNVAADRNTFLFVSRKGLAPQTVCGDCGTPISCPNCKLPAMLHETRSGNRIYACHHCQETLPSETTCPTCHGWRLVPLGIGSAGVRDELNRLFPDVPVIIIDSDHIKTAAQLRKAYHSFSSKKGSILIGTEMALRAIAEPVDTAAVISIDSRFSIPDYRIHEHTYRTLIHLRERSKDALILQTRHPKHPLFSFFRTKPYAAFYEHELAERKAFGYPPFTTLIRIGVTEPVDTVQKTVDRIMEKLTAYDVVSYDALRPKKKGQVTIYILLKVPSNAWQRVAENTPEEGDKPYEQLLGILRSFSPSITVEYDPVQIV